MASPKIYAPMLRIARIHDTGSDIGEIQTWDPNTNSPAGSGLAYGLVITNINNGNSPTSVGHLMAEKVWNSVWNDYADFQLLKDDKYIPGKCYIDTIEGATLPNDRCQLSVIGIASDTFAQAVGKISKMNQVPIAVSGWVLAYVDKEYPCGTPLTNDADGNLTEMTLDEKRNFPERLIAIYKKKEECKTFGTKAMKIIVDNRHWVKVKS